MLGKSVLMPNMETSGKLRVNQYFLGPLLPVLFPITENYESNAPVQEVYKTLYGICPRFLWKYYIVQSLHSVAVSDTLCASSWV